MSDHVPMPEFFDLQVNGYAGADFNDENLPLSLAESALMQLQSEGVSGILATVITATQDQMIARIRRIVQLREQSPVARQMIAGLHIEGPFISGVDGFVGAHPVACTGPCDRDFMAKMLDAGEGMIRLVTLAPEQDSHAAMTRWLTDQNVCVSAGHCDASIDQLKESIDQGLRMFTHLGNGCPAMMHRHDNIVQRVLSLAEQLIVCFIADGFHVPMATLGNYIRCVPEKNLLFTTDCISAAGLGPGTYSIGGQQVEVQKDMPPMSADRSHFVGSAARMPDMYARLLASGLTSQQLEYSMSRLPRAVLGLETKCDSRQFSDD